jgi:hypothetical protein
VEDKGRALPTADEIAVHEVLDKLDGEFSRVGKAVANGEFALWIRGSPARLQASGG